ncbi:hypothetical protein JTB14_011149 [Gonioctena quinquepunctata]|nr:hypothetical protein JTB14_011149 [Gonioctena quinquepunctata]
MGARIQNSHAILNLYPFSATFRRKKNPSKNCSHPGTYHNRTGEAVESPAPSALEAIKTDPRLLRLASAYRTASMRSICGEGRNPDSLAGEKGHKLHLKKRRGKENGRK